MPTGWRPPDVREKFPTEVIQDVYGFKRYQTSASRYLKAYAIFQMVCTLALILFMFYNYTEIGFSGLLLFGAYVFLGIFGYTSLMDRQNFAFYIELFRGIAGIALIWSTNDWFGINSIWEYGSLVIALYFGLSILGGFYFTFVERAGMEQQIAL
jgi:hypothetical protein